MQIKACVKQENSLKFNVPLMFQTLIVPSLDAVMICSESGAKHNQVTALCTSINMRDYKETRNKNNENGNF